MNYTRLAVLALGIGIGFIANAQKAPKALPKVDLAAGKELYHQHCSTCHGNDGKGSGTMYDPNSADKSRRVPPVDLTVMSQQNAGKFPEDRVRDAIYSKKPIPGHGNPGYGDVFYNQKYNPKVIDARVRNVTAYIESIQAAAK
jgi:mono/diheme cytochrome c family protein